MKPTFRCSSLDRVIPCPGSITLSELVDERESDSPYEGIMGHWKIAARAIEELGATEPDGGLPPPEVSESYTWNDDSDWLVNYCFRFLKELIPSDWAMEVEVPMAYDFDRFILSGHTDKLAVNTAATHVILVDWKLGHIPVDAAEQNRQILGYIALTKRAYPTATRIDAYIVQPRNDEDAGFPRVTSVTVIGDEIDACIAELEGEINNAIDNPNEIETGLAQCRYCPVAIQCPLIQAEIDHMKLTLTPEHIARIRSTPNDATLVDAVLSAKLIANPLESAKELLIERIEENGFAYSSKGNRVTIKETGGSYKADEPGLILAALNGIAPAHEVAKTLSFSTTRIKDLIAEQMDVPKGGKSAVTAKTVFDERFSRHFTQGKRKLLVFS